VQRAEGAAHHGDYHSGLDIAKRVFQLHGVDAAGRAVLRRKLQRSEVLAFFKALPPCLVGIEACRTAHYYWAREIREVGHEVRLMPPSYVAAYVKRGKTDAADAACRSFCMDRLPFASEGVPSEVADMYPACRSARGPWP
jgi:transposase